MAAAANKLAAELAFKANVDAVARDYVCEPHLGESGPCGWVRGRVVCAGRRCLMLAVLGWAGVAARPAAAAANLVAVLHTPQSTARSLA
jgi:hypothetical protein